MYCAHPHGGRLAYKQLQGKWKVECVSILPVELWMWMHHQEHQTGHQGRLVCHPQGVTLSYEDKPPEEGQICICSSRIGMIR